MITIRQIILKHTMLMDKLDIDSDSFAKEHHVTVQHGFDESEHTFLLDRYYDLIFDTPQHEAMFRMKYSEYL